MSEDRTLDVDVEIESNDLELDADVEGGVIISQDYNRLYNKPSINGHELIGNYNEQDPTVIVISNEEINRIIDEVFD